MLFSAHGNSSGMRIFLGVIEWRIKGLPTVNLHYNHCAPTGRNECTGPMLFGAYWNCCGMRIFLGVIEWRIKEPFTVNMHITHSAPTGRNECTDQYHWWRPCSAAVRGHGPPRSNVAFSCRRACGRLGTCLCLCPLNGSPLASVIGQLQRLVSPR